MTDAVLQYDPDQGAFDVVIDAGEPRQSTGLATSVIVSLFSDRRAANDDVLPDNSSDRRGCWTDSYKDGDPSGSRVWLLSRAKILPDTVQRVEEYARESLQWLVADGEVKAVQVLAERIGADTIGLQIALIVDAFDEAIGLGIEAPLMIDGLDVILMLRLFSRLDDVHFPEFEG